MTATTTDSTGLEALTRHVYDQLLAGRRDILEQLLHEDFSLSGTRERLGRTEWLDCLLNQTRLDTVEVDIVKSDRVLDNTAVVTSRVTYTGEQHSDALTGTWIVIDVWKASGIDWHLLSRTTFAAQP